MENNNRQGCRWVLDFDFWKSSNYEPVEEGNYQGLYKYKYDVKGSGTFYTAKELLDKYLKATESIEPCTTSSWQLCPKCNGDGNLSRYNSPNLSTTTHPICDVCMGSKIIATPSPTGDRDCEKLKKRITELELFLKDHEQWEADLIGEDSMWWPQRKRDLLAGKLYDSFIELQEKRNQLLNKHP